MSANRTAAILMGLGVTMSCGGDVSHEDAMDSDADAADTTSADVDDSADGTDGCYGGPQEECPCTRAEYEGSVSFCLKTARGLTCSVRNITTTPLYVWTAFNDCGCVAGPPCDGQVVYELCPPVPADGGGS